MLLLICAVVALRAEEDEGIFKSLYEKYDKLPEQGKFATGAAIGYTSSRMAVGTATTVLKVAGATYIA